jgi:hypothetical protein
MNQPLNIDDTDLPDHDYESIYGREAMHARLLAKLDAILKRMDERSKAHPKEGETPHGSA